MADCFPPESDDLHRRWLPREIFADIGIVDPDSAAAAVSEPTPDAAAAVEELAAQLAGILGGGSKVWPLAAPPPPPPVAAPPHGAQVCGLEGNVVVSCGCGTNGGGGGGAVSWPFVPYPLLQWQVGSNLMNHGHVPPPTATLRGGTGVFLPRVEAYRYAHKTATPPPATAKGTGAAAKPWSGSRPATGKKQQQTEHATPPTKQQHQKQATAGAALALPQDWSYR